MMIQEHCDEHRMLKYKESDVLIAVAYRKNTIEHRMLKHKESDMLIAVA